MHSWKIIANVYVTMLHVGSVFCHSLDKIKDILSQDAVDSLTKLVLVNAIYFKGNWNKQFQESATRDTPFKLNKVKHKLLVCVGD